jgi:DNA polymerase III epsilon subunit-like protein
LQRYGKIGGLVLKIIRDSSSKCVWVKRYFTERQGYGSDASTGKRPPFFVKKLFMLATQEPSICQIGICRVEIGLIVYKDCFLVQPPNNEYSHWNVIVHGISPDQTQNHPTFPEIWDKIKDYHTKSYYK